MLVFITARKRSLGQGNIFTPVCHSVHRGGACMVAPRGACMVALGRGVCGCLGGHAWLLLGGMHGCSRGACMVALVGACVVAPGGACVVAPRGRAWDTMRYGDTINERAVRILLECILVSLKVRDFVPCYQGLLGKNFECRCFCIFLLLNEKGGSIGERWNNCQTNKKNPLPFQCQHYL